MRVLGVGAATAVARMLRSRFARSLGSLTAGDVTWLHMLALTTETRHLDDQTAQVVEAAVLEKAPRQTVGQTPPAPRTLSHRKPRPSVLTRSQRR